MRFVFFPVCLLLIFAPFSLQAKMYKWVDDEGQVHFGDKIPTEYLQKEHDELNEHGVTTRHREAAKTHEQRIEEKRLERQKKKAELIEKKKKQRDRVLLDTYTTEADLVAARDSRLDAVDTQIRLAKSIIAESNTKIESLEKNVAAIKASNRKVPDDIYKRISSQKQQIETHSMVMQKHIKRRDEIKTQFDEYIVRFRVLKAEQKAKRERYAKEQGL